MTPMQQAIDLAWWSGFCVGSVVTVLAFMVFIFVLRVRRWMGRR